MRCLLSYVLCAIALSGACFAQNGQFAADYLVLQPAEGGRVASFQTGYFQNEPHAEQDILYINAPTSSNGQSSVQAGIYLNSPTESPSTSALNGINFHGATNVVAALDDFDFDGITDFAFAISGPGIVSNNLCIYYGTGIGISDLSTSRDSYDGGNAYPATGPGKSGCMTLPAPQGQGMKTPNLAYIASLPQPNHHPLLLVEDGANSLLYIFSNSGAAGTNGTLPGFSLLHTYQLTDGAGPVTVGYFNNDGYSDFIINGQTNYTATVFLGQSNGGFGAPVTVNVGGDGRIHSLLMQDMDDHGTPDMVVERDNGVIEIHRGNGDGTFSASSEGGTLAGLDGTTGNGGHLALIDPSTLNILTTTPIGLSVLVPQSQGTLNYKLQGIYDIGAGRNSFALGSFLSGNTGHEQLIVDSAEGVAVFYEDTAGDGGFKNSIAYPVGAPALDATVGNFRSKQTPHLDVLAATGATQAELLEGNGDGNFNLPTAQVGVATSGIPANIWSKVLTADFNGDGYPDIAYSLTGVPAPSASGSGLYIQYGNGDGTFAAPIAVPTSAVPSGNVFYAESAVGDFNGDGNWDIATIDPNYFDILLGQPNGKSSGTPFSLGMNQQLNGNGIDSPVAVGFFTEKANGVAKTNKQDLIAQQGTSLIPYSNSKGDGINFTAMPALSGTPTAGSNLVATAVLLTDIDGDGFGDVVALYHNTASDPSNPSASTSNWLYLWYGNGNGAFTAPVSIQLSRNYYLAAVGDMKGNGSPDLILSDGVLVDILYNQGSRLPQFKSDCGSFGPNANDPCIDEVQFLAGQGINAIVVQSVQGKSVPDLIVANGGATISNPSIILSGATGNSAGLTANPDVNTGGITVLLNNTSTTTTGTLPVNYSLTSIPAIPSYGEAFTLYAVLSPVSGTQVPGGTVAFSIDGNQVCTPFSVTAANNLTGAPANAASTLCPIPAGNVYPAGPHKITAVYSGDSSYAPKSLGPTSFTILAGTTTSIGLCVGPTVNCPANGAPVVTPPYPASLSMVYGQIWNGVYSVTSADNAASLPGNIVFFDQYNGAQTQLCSVVYKQVCPTVDSNDVGTHVITAQYVPGTADPTHTGSSSSSVTISVAQDTGTKVVVTGTPNPSPQYQTVTFTAMVTGSYAAPTGSVAFMNGGTLVCSGSLVATVSSGNTSTAMCTTSSLPAGTDSITANYGGTTEFVAAPSAAFQETITAVTKVDFTVALSQNPVVVSVGAGANLNVTVTPQSSFTEAVNLACANLPSGAQCTFVQPQIASGGGKTLMILATTAPHNCSDSQPYFFGANGGGSGIAPIALPALAGLLALFIPGRRRLVPGWRRCLRALVVLLLVAGATQMTGCSNCTDLGTRPGTYTFQVTGTSAVTGEVQTQTVTLNVTI